MRKSHLVTGNVSSGTFPQSSGRRSQCPGSRAGRLRNPSAADLGRVGTLAAAHLPPGSRHCLDIKGRNWRESRSSVGVTAWAGVPGHSVASGNLSERRVTRGRSCLPGWWLRFAVSVPRTSSVVSVHSSLAVAGQAQSSLTARTPKGQRSGGCEGGKLAGSGALGLAGFSLHVLSHHQQLRLREQTARVPSPSELSSG